MNIVIPENVDTGEVKVLPNGLATVAIEKVIVGLSKANKPKVTIIYTIIEEMAEPTEDGSSTVGEKVLEDITLQPHALFSLARLWKDATGTGLPQGDYNEKEFEALLQETLLGTEWSLLLEGQVPSDGSSDKVRTNVIKRAKK